MSPLNEHQIPNLGVARSNRAGITINFNDLHLIGLPPYRFMLRTLPLIYRHFEKVGANPSNMERGTRVKRRGDI